MKKKKFVLSACALAAMSALALTPEDYLKTATVTVSGYTGSETLSSFPLLVRLSTAIEKFRYDDFELPNGGDLRFTDASGNLLPSEVDTWDPSGESLVWVKVPSFTNGMTLKIYFGNATPDAMNPQDVWSNYLGVWHFNSITDGVTPDATGNGLHMTAKDTTLQVVDPDGRIGASLVNGKINTKGLLPAEDAENGGFISPVYNSIFSNESFTVSAWFNRKDGRWAGGQEVYFSTERNQYDSRGFYLLAKDINNDSATLYVENQAISAQIPNRGSKTWGRSAVSFNGKDVAIYANGSPVEGTATAAPQHIYGFAVGSHAANGGRVVMGSIDEVRFAKFTASDDWEKAEYDQVTSGSFLSVGAVESTAGDDPELGPVTLALADDNRFAASTTLTAGRGSVRIIATAGETAVTNELADVRTAPAAVEGLTAELASDTAYRVRAEAVNGKMIAASEAEEAVYNGALSVARVSDAWVSGRVAGRFRIARASGAASVRYPLGVCYTVSGSAVAGTDYAELSGTAVIPADASFVDIEVRPIAETLSTDPATVTVTLEGGLYRLSGEVSASLTIKPMHDGAQQSWTGAASDGAFNAPGNWDPKLAPMVDDEITIKAPAEGSIDLTLSDDTFCKNMTLIADSTSTGSVDMDLRGHGITVTNRAGNAYNSIATAAPMWTLANGSYTCLRLLVGYNRSSQRYVRAGLGLTDVDLWTGDYVSVQGNGSSLVANGGTLSLRSGVTVGTQRSYEDDVLALTNLTQKLGTVNVFGTRAAVSLHNVDYARDALGQSLQVGGTDCRVSVTGDRADQIFNVCAVTLAGTNNFMRIEGVVCENRQIDNGVARVNFQDSVYPTTYGNSGNVLEFGPTPVPVQKRSFSFKDGTVGNRLVVDTGANVRFVKDVCEIFGMNNAVVMRGALEVPSSTFSTKAADSDCRVELDGDAATLLCTDSTTWGHADNVKPLTLAFKPGATLFGGVAPITLQKGATLAENVIIEVTPPPTERRVKIPLIRRTGGTFEPVLTALSGHLVLKGKGEASLSYEDGTLFCTFRPLRGLIVIIL